MTATKVSTADFIKNYGQLADQALTEPITITKNGRDRLVILSVEEYGRLKRRDRKVYRAEDIPDDLLAAIAAAKAPEEAKALDFLLDDEN